MTARSTLPRRLAATLTAALTATFFTGCSTPPPAPAEAALPALPTAWRGAADSADSADNLAERPNGDVFRDAELARAQYGIQHSALWPTLAADASATRQQSPSALSATDNLTSTLYRAGLAVPAWEIDLWGRLRALSDGALRNLESTDARRRFVQVRLVELRYTNGISGCFEVLDAQRQLFDAELQLTQLTNGAYASVIELYRSLGGGWTPPVSQ